MTGRTPPPGMASPPRSGAVFVIGAGPGVGLETARRFARAGHPVGLVARDPERLGMLVTTLQEEGFTAVGAPADIREPRSLEAALGDLVRSAGSPSVVCFCPLPDIARIKPVLDTDGEDLMAALDLVVGGAAATVRATLPLLRQATRAAILFTTGSAGIAPSAERASSAVSTAAATTYISLLREALEPEGITVSHVVVVGAVGRGLKHEPAAVAQQLWTESHTPSSGGSSVLD